MSVEHPLYMDEKRMQLVTNTSKKNQIDTAIVVYKCVVDNNFTIISLIASPIMKNNLANSSKYLSYIILVLIETFTIKSLD